MLTSWFLTQGAVSGFGTREALFSLLAAVLSFAVFVGSQRRGSDAMFDFSVLRIRRFSGALIGAAAMNFSFWPFMIYLPLYFQNSLGYSSVGTGLALLAYTLPTLVVPPFGVDPHLDRRLRRRAGHLPCPTETRNARQHAQPIPHGDRLPLCQEFCHEAPIVAMPGGKVLPVGWPSADPWRAPSRCPLPCPGPAP